MDLTLFVTNDFGPRTGGIETFIHGLIQRLPKSSVIVFTSSQGSASDTKEYDERWFEEFGVRIFRDRSRMLLPSPRVISKARKLVAEFQPTTIVFGAAAPLGMMGKLLPASRKIAITHGHEVWWAKIFPLSLALRLIGNSVDHLTYLGDFTKRAISKPLSKPARASMVQLAPGIDLQDFKPTPAADLRAKLGLSDKEVIVSVGRLVPRKGQDQLIKAMPMILREIPSAHLLIVGGGEYRAKLKELVAERGLSENVTFTGRVAHEELARYICVGDIFAMPARSRFAGLEVEGLGIVYLEASACGLPVLCGDSGGAPDAVQSGKTGYIVGGKDVSAVAAGVIRLLKSDRAAMGAAGRAWVIQNWSLDDWAAKFVQLVRGA